MKEEDPLYTVNLDMFRMRAVYECGMEISSVRFEEKGNILVFGTSDGDLGLVMIEDILEKRNDED